MDGEQETTDTTQAEIIAPPTSNKQTTMLVVAIVAVAAISAAAAIGVYIWGNPDEHISGAAAIFAFMLPIVLPLLALLQSKTNAQVKDLHLAVNSRLTELLQTSTEKAKAEAVAETEGSVIARAQMDTEELKNTMLEMERQHEAALAEAQRVAYEQGMEAGAAKTVTDTPAKSTRRKGSG